MYKIKLESIGGYGANLVSKLLGEIGFSYLNKYSRAFSSYGSEKRGSPVKSYIYYSDNKIRVNTPITKPDILCIFTLSLAESENILSGVDENTNVIINSDKDVDFIVEKMKLPDCNLWIADGVKIAMECNSRVNMALFGAIAKASGFINMDYCIEIAEKYLKGNGNINAIKSGYNSVKHYNIKSDYSKKEYKEIVRNPLKGGINKSNGSTITNDLQGCREGMMPKYIREKCIDCGLCESTCPDFVFQFKDGVNLGMDLYHCKGCMRCVEICPTNALVSVNEGEYTKNIGNIHLVNKDFYFDKTGYSSLIEGDVYDAEGSTDKSI